MCIPPYDPESLYSFRPFFSYHSPERFYLGSYIYIQEFQGKIKSTQEKNIYCKAKVYKKRMTRSCSVSNIHHGLPSGLEMKGWNSWLWRSILELIQVYSKKQSNIHCLAVEGSFGSVKLRGSRNKMVMLILL